MGIRIGYAAGAFDLFHIGHLNILRNAKSNCDYLVAGVVSDDVLEQTKGRRPIIPLPERLEIVREIGCVDRAIEETHADKMLTWQELGFNVFFKGDDWRGTAKGLDLEQRFAVVGVQVIYFPYTIQTSSSTLRTTLETFRESARGMPSTLRERTFP